MASPGDCNNRIDPLPLVREGTSQPERSTRALDPAYAPVNERTTAHGMAFAMAYSAFLRLYDASNVPAGDWTRFFSNDPSVRLAVAAIQDVGAYRLAVKGDLDFLKDNGNASDDVGLKERLGSLFSSAGTLALQFDGLKEGLPSEGALTGTLQTLIRRQLAPAFQELLALYKFDQSLAPNDRLVADAQPELEIFGRGALPFSVIFGEAFSNDWITDGSADWATFTTAIVPDGAPFGSATGVFDRVRHLATHNLFTSIFDRFLRVLARVAADAAPALEESIIKRDTHEPHYALFLAYLRLFEHARAEANALTGRHLDLYYREILRLKEKPPTPSRAHLLLELAKQVPYHQVDAGVLFKAGKDAAGHPALFGAVTDTAVNQASVAALMTLYRHAPEMSGTAPPVDRDLGRLFASPVANSDDGLGAPLTAPDLSWHPFSNKIYTEGVLAGIRMPQAQIGFAVASHYLLMAEGKRDVLLDLTVSGFGGTVGEEWASLVTCSFSGEKGWIDVNPRSFKATSATNFLLTVSLPGDAPAVVPCDPEVHGVDLGGAPVMKVTLVHQRTVPFAYALFEDVEVSRLRLLVNVEGVRRLTVSNDAGPVDPSKPFFPFGPQPETSSAFLVGSDEMFCKRGLLRCVLNISWKNKPALASIAYLPIEQYVPSPAGDPYKNAVPGVTASWLREGVWADGVHRSILDASSDVSVDIMPQPGAFTPLDRPEVRFEAPYAATTKSGYVRLALEWGLGHRLYRDALADYMIAVAKSVPGAVKPTEPYTPEVGALSAGYAALQDIQLVSAARAAFDARTARLYHVTSFGQAEQHPWLKIQGSDRSLYLFPQMRHLNTSDRNLPAGQPVKHEAELYIGIAGLQPPQNLSLLFEAADGTADPLLAKPDPHIQWSYLRGNEWVPFAEGDVVDGTGEMLDAGIVRLAVPRDASDVNTLLPAGMCWVRAAVATASDAVCRQRMVAAQAVEVVFTDKGNDPAFPAAVLPPGTVSRLDVPDADVKSVAQPFATFGGRGAELPAMFSRRVSERLRHKDRAIALWDYERLVLEAFPALFRAKCLNHTRYEPTQGGTGVYNELAPGHVTVVTIPDLQFAVLRNPLRPYTSLGLLEHVAAFLRARLTCFATLHVKNPQCEEVRVRCRVRLRDGVDETIGVNRLKEEITRFLSPWAFPGGGSPTFGGKVEKSVLINFVEERPYVDYVTDFQLFHDVNSVHGTVDNNEVEGTRAVSLLVSVPASRHEVTVIRPWEETVQTEQCPCES